MEHKNAKKPAIFKFTVHSVERLPFSKQGQALFWDKDMAGFGLRVGANSKVYICQGRVDGKNVRITLGRHPILSLDDARLAAKEKLLEMVKGVNPTERKREEIVAQKHEAAIRTIKSVTFRQAYLDYLDRGGLEKTTIKQYDYAIYKKYAEIVDLPLLDITKDQIERIHMSLVKDISGQTANKCARAVRAVFKFAMGKYEVAGKPLLAVNPVDRIKDTRKWQPLKRKTGHLKSYHIGPALKALDEFEGKEMSEVMADYIRFAMFTGCRRDEVGSLKWEDVNLKNRSFVITIDKAKNDNPLELPLSDYLMRIIERRYEDKVNDFVFPSPTSATGRIVEPKKAFAKVSAQIDHKFSCHDLRRTFITIADSLDISHYALKALVNHKMSKSDVTAGYIQMSVERLREPMQRITDYMLESAKIDLEEATAAD